MKWAIKFAVKTLVVGFGLAGTLAVLTGSEHDDQPSPGSPTNQSAALCALSGADAKRCACMAGVITDKQQLETLITLGSSDDPKKAALDREVQEKCGG